jgi:hypothetical protein
LCTLAEIGWSLAAALDYRDLSRRLAVQERRLDLAGVAYWHDPAVKIGAWEPAQPRAITNTLEWAVPPGILAPGKYRLSLNHLKGRNGLKISGAELLEDGQEVARDGHDGLAGAGYN